MPLPSTSFSAPPPASVRQKTANSSESLTLDSYITLVLNVNDLKHWPQWTNTEMVQLPLYKQYGKISES